MEYDNESDKLNSSSNEEPKLGSLQDSKVFIKDLKSENSSFRRNKSSLKKLLTHLETYNSAPSVENLDRLEGELRTNIPAKKRQERYKKSLDKLQAQINVAHPDEKRHLKRQYREAYEKSVKYHGTRYSETGLTKGLDPEQGGTNTRGRDHHEDSAGKVFMAHHKYPDSAWPYADQDQSGMLRIALPASRLREKPSEERIDLAYARGNDFANEKDADQMFGDKRMRGQAVFTAKPIPPETIWNGPSSTMLKSEKADAIVSNIRENLEGPEDSKPSIEDLKKIHQACIDDGYLSDEAGDTNKNYLEAKNGGTKK